MPIVQPPTGELPEQYEAFRPIMPGQFAPPIPPALTTPLPASRNEPPPVELLPDTATQSKIEELNQRITELEMQLEAAKKIPLSLDSEPQPPLTEKMEAKPIKTLPIINKQGVHVCSDEMQMIRIVVVDNNLFMPNVWQLSAEGEETLRAVAAEIRASDSRAILDIEGHTDSLMGDPNNPMQKHEISTAKTAAVMDFFVNALRWDTARIGTSSYGRSRPVADNATPENRAKNNRIEIVVRRENG